MKIVEQIETVEATVVSHGADQEVWLHDLNESGSEIQIRMSLKQWHEVRSVVDKMAAMLPKPEIKLR